MSALACLHALYMQILYGDAKKAGEKERALMNEEEMKQWEDLRNVSRERLYVKFASELAVCME